MIPILYWRLIKGKNLRLSTLSWGILCDSGRRLWWRWSNRCALSTLSWGILCDSFRSQRGGFCSRWTLFQPSLEEFFVIQFLVLFWQNRGEGNFQPSLEEFFVILYPGMKPAESEIFTLSTLSWGILCDSWKFKRYKKLDTVQQNFQPSLEEFFVILYSNWITIRNIGHINIFQPSLEEFFVILVILLLRLPMGLGLSTLSWGILCDSSSQKQAFQIEKMLFPAFNPLLRNSLWFLCICVLLSLPLLFSTFQPSLEEFFVIPILLWLVVWYIPSW